MDRETSRDSQMSYLRAIQKIPGDTASEKFSWIERLASRQTIEDLEQFPSELLPLLRVEIAVKKKRHEDITSALKSEDLTIINRAFKASWFFDGSHKEIVNVTYFCERLFPYVSVNTRKRIVITLAHRLSGKDPIFAQQIFTAVESTFDVKTAYPLFMACDETFTYETIVEKRFALPIEIVLKIFRKNPNLVVRFLKLLKPAQKNVCPRDPFAIGINRYKSLLPKLIKKRVEDFVELYETHLPNIFLTNTCAELFLKKAKQHVIKKPLRYFHILPPKKINKHLMESMFPGMLPENKVYFSTNKILDYLKYYPCDNKYEFLCKSYKNKYNADFLDETSNVTMDLLRMLSAEERIKLARIKIEKESLSVNPGDYKTAWICYLSVNEAIPAIKEEINKTANEKDRLSFIKQMIYACKINEDDDALSDTLIYFLHKNETCHIFEQTFEILLLMYAVAHLNKKQVSIIMEIVRLFYVKNTFTLKKVLMAIVPFRLIHNMPIEDLISMFLQNYMNFNILKEYPQYERHCLVTFAKLIQKEPFKDLNFLKRGKLCKFVEAMYDFNDRCKNSDIKIEKITIRDYPWLMDAILEIISLKKKCPYKFIHHVLYLHEPELYRSRFKSADEEESEESQNYIAKVTSGAALVLLKRNLPSILDNWEKYLENSMKNYYRKQVQLFIRTMRWYKDLPVKFAECCMDYVYEKRESRISSGMGILANLLHGDALTKLLDLFLPPEKKINPFNKDDYTIVRNLSLSMRLSNPPISLDFIIRLCQGNYYLPIVLMTLRNVSRRTSLPKVISTAQKLAMYVSLQNHGLIWGLLFSECERLDFYQERWSTEKHYSIRQVLFKEIQHLFTINPKLETWSLYYQTVSTLNLNDEALVSEMISSLSHIFNEYIMKYLDLRLKMIDNFQEMGSKEINKYIIQYLTMIFQSKKEIFNFLSEELFENLFRRYLFHVNTDISDKMNSLCFRYILSEDKHEARFKVFADIFRNAVTSYCNVPQSPEKLHFYPVKIVRSFINDFIIYVSEYFFCNMGYSINPSISIAIPQSIDNMQILFSSVLLPVQDAQSYLLLVYVKKFQECKESSSMKSFGLKIGQHLPELIDIFSSLLVSFMAEVLEYLFQIFYKFSPDYIKKEELKLSTIEGLIEAGNTDSCFIAAKILPSTLQSMVHTARYNQLIEKFQEMQEPAITTVLFNNHHFKFVSKTID